MAGKSCNLEILSRTEATHAKRADRDDSQEGEQPLLRAEMADCLHY
jgi:hypothetical protein